MEFAALILLVLVASLGYHRIWRRAREKQRPAVCRVDQIAPGWVELRGRVRGTGTVRSPVSGRRVVGYSVNIEEERGFTAWDLVVDVSRVADFELEDETGRVIVRASHSEVQLDTKQQRGRGGPFRAVPARVVRLLHHHGRSVAGVLFGRAFRWREHLLEDGQTVRLRGWVDEVEAEGERDEALFHGYRELPRHYAVFGHGEHPVQLATED